jgi:hypothetical protein
MTHDIIISIRSLTPDQKQKFFQKNLSSIVRPGFFEDWGDIKPGFSGRCNKFIYWAQWDDACRDFGFLELISLPLLQNGGDLDYDRSTLLKDALRAFCLPVKTTNKIQYLMSRLPERCYDHMLSAEQEGQLIDFLDYLLTEKTTKTFEDLL